MPTPRYGQSVFDLLDSLKKGLGSKTSPDIDEAAAALGTAAHGPHRDYAPPSLQHQTKRFERGLPLARTEDIARAANLLSDTGGVTPGILPDPESKLPGHYDIGPEGTQWASKEPEFKGSSWYQPRVTTETPGMEPQTGKDVTLRSVMSDPRWAAAGVSPHKILRRHKAAMKKLDLMHKQRKPFPWDEYRTKKRDLQSKFLAEYKLGLAKAFGAKWQGEDKPHAAAVLVPTGRTWPGTDVPEHRVAIPDHYIPDQLKMSKDISPEVASIDSFRSRTVQTEDGPVEVVEKVEAPRPTTEVQLSPNTDFVYNPTRGLELVPNKHQTHDARIQRLNREIAEVDEKLNALDIAVDGYRPSGLSEEEVEHGVTTFRSLKTGQGATLTRETPGATGRTDLEDLRGRLNDQLQVLKRARSRQESPILISVDKGEVLHKAKTVRVTAPRTMHLPWGLSFSFPGSYEAKLTPHDAEFYAAKKGSGNPLEWWDWFSGAARGEMVEAVEIDGYRLAGNLSDAERWHNNIMVRYSPHSILLGLGSTVTDYARGVEGYSADDPLHKRHGARSYDPQEKSPLTFLNMGRFLGQAIPSLFRSKTWIEGGLALSGSELSGGWRGEHPVGDIEFFKTYKRYGLDPMMFDITGLSKSDQTMLEATAEGISGFGPGFWNAMIGTFELAFQGLYATSTPKHAYEKTPMAIRTAGEMAGAVPNIGYGLLADPKVIVAEDPFGAATVLIGGVKPVPKWIRSKKSWQEAAARRALAEEMKPSTRLDSRVAEVADYYNSARSVDQTTQYVSQNNHLVEVMARNKEFPVLSSKIAKLKRRIQSLQAEYMSTKGKGSRAKKRKIKRMLSKANKDLKVLLNKKSPRSKEATLHSLREQAYKTIKEEGARPATSAEASARVNSARSELKAAREELIAAEEASGMAHRVMSTAAKRRVSQAEAELSAANKAFDDVHAREAGSLTGRALAQPSDGPVKYAEGTYVSDIAEGPGTVRTWTKPKSDVKGEWVKKTGRGGRTYYEKVTPQLPAAPGTFRWGTEVRFSEPPTMQSGWVKRVNAAGRDVWVRESLRKDIEAWRFARDPLSITRQPMEGVSRVMFGGDPLSITRFLRNPPEPLLSLGKKWIENRWDAAAKQRGYLSYVDKIYTSLPEAIVSASKLYPMGSWIAPFEFSRLIYNRLVGQRSGMAWWKKFTRSPEKIIPAAIDGIAREHMNTRMNQWDLDAHAALQAIPDKTITYKGKTYNIRKRVGEALHTEAAQSSFTFKELNVFHQYEAAFIKTASKADRMQMLAVIDKLRTRLDNARNNRIDGYRWVEASKRGGRGQWEIDSDVGRFLKLMESKGNKHAKARLADLVERRDLLNKWAKPLSQQIADTVALGKKYGIIDNPSQALQWWMPESYKQNSKFVEWYKNKFSSEVPRTRSELRRLHKHIEQNADKLHSVRTGTGKSLGNELRQAGVPFETRVKKYGLIQNLNQEVFSGIRSLRQAVANAEYFNALAKMKGKQAPLPGAKVWEIAEPFVLDSLPAHWTKAQRSNWAQLPNTHLFERKVETRTRTDRPPKGELASWREIKGKDGKVRWEMDVTRKSKARKYHDASGLWIRKELLYDILLSEYIQEAARTWISGYVRHMKGNFTIRHPAVHLRNGAFNGVIFSVYADINPFNPRRWKLYEQMTRDTASQNKSLFFNIAFEEGVHNSNFARAEGLVQAQGKAMRGFFGSAKDLMDNTLELMLPMNANMKARLFGLGKATRWQAFKTLFEEIPGMLYTWGDASFKHTAGLRNLEKMGFYKIDPATKLPGLYNPATGRFIKDIKEFRKTEKGYQDKVRGAFRKGTEDFLNYLRQPMYATMLSTPTKVPWTNMKGEVGVMPGSRAFGFMSISQFPAFLSKAVPRMGKMFTETPMNTFRAGSLNTAIDSLTEAFADGLGITDGQMTSIMDVQERYNSLLSTVPLTASIDTDALKKARDQEELEPSLEFGDDMIVHPPERIGLEFRQSDGGRVEFFVPHRGRWGSTGEPVRPPKGMGLVGEPARPVRKGIDGAWLTMHQIGNKKILHAMTGHTGAELDRVQKEILEQIPIKATELQTRWLMPGAEYAGSEPPQKITTAWDAIRAIAYPSGMPAKYIAAAITGDDPYGRLKTGKPTVYDETSIGQLSKLGWEIAKDHVGVVAHYLDDYMDVKNGKTDWRGKPLNLKGKYGGLRMKELTTEDKFRLSGNELLHIVRAEGDGQWFKDEYGQSKEEMRAMLKDDSAGTPDAQTGDEKRAEWDEGLNFVKRDRLQDLLSEYYNDVKHFGTTVDSHHVVRVELYELFEEDMPPMTPGGNEEFLERAGLILSIIRADLDDWDKYIRMKHGSAEQAEKARSTIVREVTEREKIQNMTPEDLGLSKD